MDEDTGGAGRLAALRPARRDDFEPIVALLREANLPVDDLAPDCIEWFLVAVEGAPVAAGAVEPLVEGGLLRSLAVAPHARGRGLGQTLVAGLERRAAAAGVRSLYLLTTGAAAFFEALGYRAIERDAVPAAVRASRQFASICPASARCMTKPLAH